MPKSTAHELYEEIVDTASGRRVHARVSRLGRDLVVAVGGGESAHVGSVVMAQPHPSGSCPDRVSISCSVLTIPPHKEEPVARAVATRLAEVCNCVVVVCAGIHEDHLDAEGIGIYLELVDQLADALVSRLRSG